MTLYFPFHDLIVYLGGTSVSFAERMLSPLREKSLLYSRVLIMCVHVIVYFGGCVISSLMFGSALYGRIKFR